MPQTLEDVKKATEPKHVPKALLQTLTAASNTVKVSPGHGKAGRQPNRHLLDTLSGNRDPGMFGNMFPKLAPLDVPDAKLQALADAMMEASGGDPSGDNPNIPAGFTFLGQFIDHDITLDLTSLAEKQKDPLGIENFRTPALDLDCVYGLGPDGSPHLYARGSSSDRKHGPKLLIGRNFDSGEGAFRNDLPRSPEGFALIGDHRNDENLLVAQTHLLFLKFHNAVCDRLAKSTNPPPDVFSEARRLTSWHFQWIVLHDWVERLTEPGIVAKILHDGRKFYRFRRTPFMPIEFSAAAYRLGHSMVRQFYNVNRVAGPTDFKTLFEYSGLSGGIVGDLAPTPPLDPPATAYASVPSKMILDWRRFYDLDLPPQPGVATAASRRLDPFLAKELHMLPDGTSLPFRNMKRGVNLGLPSGQDVAAAMKVKNPLTHDEIASGPDGAVAKAQGLHKATPLWYYILKEAHVRHAGLRLGPVGSTIIAEVFVGLVHGDQQSYLWQRKNWKPELPSKTAGEFTMADMIRFVDDVNPLG
ncbi:peroxidase family protein [Aquibium oceanicum]|uniref:peroxidase family protein n=1 Tax=Aquibium oceanicum TaxID=1670800 RepID=UPI000AC95044|nr:heme peroxidase family protein [Aquibium oceanicum]